MQQPAPGVSYAGNGARFIAFLIDAFIMVMIGGIIPLVFGVIAGLGRRMTTRRWWVSADSPASPGSCSST